jgi:Spy/CpxP family protein refolding chaperone
MKPTIKPKRSYIIAAVVMVTPLWIGLSIAEFPIVFAQQPPLPPDAMQDLPNQPILELTPSQQVQIRRIQIDTRSQILMILTPEQQSQFRAVTESAAPPPGALVTLNLSPEQKGQIQHVMYSQRQKINKVLTPEQKQQLFQNIQFSSPPRN